MTQSDFLRSIREYFWKQNFTEVEIPYLNSSLPIEPNIYSFKTTWTQKNKNYYLPTSPELALKKFLAKNQESRRDPLRGCFAISHCFRDLEDSGPLHTPEFLMLEWYEVGKNLDDLKKSSQKFVAHLLPKIKFTDLILPSSLPQNEPDFNQFFLNQIEPKLPRNKAVFITGYPAFLSPLAKSKATTDREAMFFLERNHPRLMPKGVSTKKKSLPNNQVAERFEFYINGIEIGNGCVENLDVNSIEKSFLSEQQYRQINHLPLHPYSHDFIESIKTLPPCSGIGLGIDRLLGIINS